MAADGSLPSERKKNPQKTRKEKIKNYSEKRDRLERHAQNYRNEAIYHGGSFPRRKEGALFRWKRKA